MSIKLIAIDLDGTLLHDDMSISTYSKEIIAKARSAGYRIVVATGRMWGSAKPKVEALGLGDVPVICYTGAWIVEAGTGKILHQEGLTPDIAAAVMDMGRRHGWSATAFWNDNIYMDHPDGTEIKYAKYRSKKPIFLGEDFYHPTETVTRVVFSDPTEQGRLAIRTALEEKFSNLCDIVFPGDDFIDVHKKGVNKAQAVQYLAGQAGITADEVMAFGNTENDVPLLQWAGTSYAVANADAVAKEAADFLCPSNEEDGVAQTIEKLLLGKN